MSDTHDCAGDAAPYVLGALEPEEAERFEAHLLTCSVCQDEVASLGGLTDSLAVSVPQMSASRGLRRRVMKEVRADAATAQRGRRARSPVRLGIGAVSAALAAAVIAFAVLQIGGSGVAVYPASVGQAEVRVSDKHAELVVHHLPPLRSGHVYEVWLKGSGAPEPTSALFTVSARGAAQVHVPGDLDHVTTIMVTEEPAGGSAVPTSAPVVVAPVS